MFVKISSFWSRMTIFQNKKKSWVISTSNNLYGLKKEYPDELDLWAWEVGLSVPVTTETVRSTSVRMNWINGSEKLGSVPVTTYTVRSSVSGRMGSMGVRSWVIQLLLLWVPVSWALHRKNLACRSLQQAHAQTKKQKKFDLWRKNLIKKQKKQKPFSTAFTISSGPAIATRRVGGAIGIAPRPAFSDSVGRGNGDSAGSGLRDATGSSERESVVTDCKFAIAPWHSSASGISDSSAFSVGSFCTCVSETWSYISTKKLFGDGVSLAMEANVAGQGRTQNENIGSQV